MERIKKYLKIPKINEHHLKKHIDRKLFNRLRIFFVIVVILVGLMLYDVFEGILGVNLAFGGFIPGLLIGFFASRIFLIHWHEESAKVVSRMDAIGVIILLCYIFFALSRAWIFEHWIHGAALTAFTFSIMGGIMLGRLLGMRLNIKKILSDRGISFEDGNSH
ncbi:MAG: hypothetical protein V1732_03750 [Patescibacteria group bacterium]